MRLPCSGRSVSFCLKSATLCAVIGFSLIAAYQSVVSIRDNHACKAWHERTGKDTWWIGGNCLHVVDGRLEEVPLHHRTPSSPRPINLNGMRSLRAPLGHCTPSYYDEEGKWWPGICDVSGTDLEPVYSLAYATGGHHG